MTSVFSADGKNVPCTVIEAGPCVVNQVKTVEKDGYAAAVSYTHLRFCRILKKGFLCWSTLSLLTVLVKVWRIRL